MRLHRTSRQRVHQPGQSHRSDAGGSSVHSAVFGRGCRSRRKPHRHLLQRAEGAGSTAVLQQQIEGAGDRDLRLKLHHQQWRWWSRVLVWSRAGPGTWRTAASSSGEVPTHHCSCPLWVTLLTFSPVRIFIFDLHVGEVKIKNCPFLLLLGLFSLLKIFPLLSIRLQPCFSFLSITFCLLSQSVHSSAVRQNFRWGRERS